MATADSRIVTMKFDNRDFQRGVEGTIQTLGKLSKVLDMGATSKAWSGLSGLASKFNLSGIGNQVGGLNGKFVALGTVAVTALSRMTNAAIDAGKSFAPQFTGINSIRQGFAEYEQKLGSVQTILANTDGKSLKDVTGALDELNHYADQTIYNFGEMARNIGTFTAAGVGLEDSVQSIKGIANLAALSGSNSQQASTAMYQLSQAIAAGRVSLADWNSVVNAGMGGKVFQEALIQSAVAMGDLEQGAVKLNKETGQLTINGESFRESISAAGGGKSWLSSKVLTNTLAQFSGDLTDAQLRAQGFTQAQIKDIRQMAAEAQNAATKVKTFSQLIDTTKEALGSGWAKTWEIVLGDFKEAKQLWTSVSDVVGGYINQQAEARNRVLADWKEAGGRADLIAGFGNIFKAFIAIVKPIREAFREIFPPATGEQLAKITEGFRNFTEHLIISEDASNALKEIFKGLFTILKIGAVVVGGIIKYVAEFFGIIITGGGGDALTALLEVAGAIGKVVSAVGGWLLEGAKLEKFFDMVIEARNNVLEPIVGVIGAIVEALASLALGDISGVFDHLSDSGQHLMDLFGVVGDRISSIVQTIADALGSLGSGGMDALQEGLERLSDGIDTVMEKLDFMSGAGGSLSLNSDPVKTATERVEKLSWVATAASNIWDGLVSAFSAVGDIAGPALAGIWEFFGNIGRAIIDGTKDLNFTEILSIINSLIAGGVLLTIRKYIGTLDNFVDMLSGVGESVSGTFDQMTGTLKTMQNSVRAEMIKSIAIAVGIMAASLVALALIPADDLTKALKALAGVSTALAGLFAVVQLSMKMGPQGVGMMLAVGAALPLFAGAILILSGALLVLEKVDWSSIGKFAVVVGAMTLALAGLGAVGPAVLAGGAALLLAAPGLIAITGALILMEKVDWESIGKMAVVLLEVSLALAGLGAIGPMVLAGAAAIFIVAPALTVMAGALLLMQKVDWGAIGKLAGILLTLSVGLTAMVAALPGAMALMTVAIALNLLMPPLVLLANMDFWTVVKAFGSLAIGLAGLALIAGPLSPLLLALGGAMTFIGIALLAGGAGMMMFGMGLSLIAASGTAAFAVLTGAITGFLIMLPQWINQFGASIQAFAAVIRQAGPPMVQAMGTLFIAILKEIRRTAPELRKTMVVLIKNGLAAIRATFPDFVKTGMQMIMNILTGLDRNIDRITDKATDVIVKFLRALGRNSPRIIQAGRDMLIDFGKGIIRQIPGIADEVYQKAKDIGSDLVAGAVKAVKDAAGNLIDEVGDMAKGALDKLGDIPGIGGPAKETYKIGHWFVEGMRLAVRDDAPRVVDQVEKVGRATVTALSRSMASLNEVAPEADMNPKITPVLDLSKIQRDAVKMGGMLDSPTVMAGVSFSQAAAISAENDAAREAAAMEASEPVVQEVKFEQHNHSPVALSDVTIYRQTKNLFSLQKEALGI